MKRSFVLDCPLCQPAFEAFCVYQSRPRFSDGSKASNFGKGLSPNIKPGLLSDTLSTRLMALRQPIRVWVERRLRTMKLTDEERRQWWEEMSQRVQQGTTTLNAQKKNDPWYREWSGYWGCAACLGSKDACNALIAEIPRGKILAPKTKNAVSPK